MRYSDRERRERFALARGYRASNLSKAEYCRRCGLSVNSLDYWLRESEKEEMSAAETAFFEVRVTDSEASPTPKVQPDLEVDLPYGVKLRFFGAAVAK